jgi:DnaK suppressor protein
MPTGVTFTGAAGQTVRLVCNREGIVVKMSPDALDEVQHAAEREIVIGNLIRDSNVVRNVRKALLDIEEGSFGVCLHCEEDIGPKRLAAVPWTPFCIHCQKSPTATTAPITPKKCLLGAA